MFKDMKSFIKKKATIHMYNQSLQPQNNDESIYFCQNKENQIIHINPKQTNYQVLLKLFEIDLILEKGNKYKDQKVLNMVKHPKLRQILEKSN